MKTILSSVLAALALAGLPANAAVYTDATGDNYSGAEVDISSAVVTNDGSNLSFKIILNQGATNGISAGANYLVGIQVAGQPTGQTNINNSTSGVTAGNPWGKRVGISTGENFFVGCYPNGSGYSGGAQLYQYTAGTGWSAQVGATAAITEVTNGTPSITFSFPLATLGLGVGDNFNFDVWTTYGSPAGQGAYDALDSSVPGGLPYSPTFATYDSATASGSTLASYTVVSGAAYEALVTFQVNMGVAIVQGHFNPAGGDYVEARGSFNNWLAGDHTGILLTNVPGTSNYVGTLATSTVSLGTTVNYKFVIDSGVMWEGNVGPNGVSDRTFILTNINQTLPFVYWNNITNANLNFPVQFKVSMAVQTALGNFTPGVDTLYVNGDWNWSGSALQLTQTADANVYTGTVALAYSPGTTINYKYAMNGGIPANSWEVNGVGPNGANNRQFVLNSATNLPGNFFNNINNLGALSISNNFGSPVLNWIPGPNIHLQSATNLTAGWVDVPDSQGQSSFTNIPGPGTRFFRLIGP